MPVVEKYWSGVLSRLQSEVEIFNELILHAGERGHENELSFARILSGLVPRRYGIGSGLLIDSRDRYSRQTDIVIYDQSDEPAVLAQTSQVLFPVESTRACFEIKTTVGSDEVDDAAKKNASVLALHSIDAPHPLYALLGYKSEVHAPTLAKSLREAGASRPSLVCVINLGFIAGYRSLLEPESFDGPDSYVCGVTLLQETDERNERVAGRYMTADPGSNRFTQREITYPVVKIDKQLLVAEPSRALLVFCEALVRNLAKRDMRSAPAFSHYITPAARDLRLLD